MFTVVKKTYRACKAWYFSSCWLNRS